MGYAILGWDGADAEAGARRARVRSRHLEVITRWAAAGRLSLAVPLLRAEGAAAGSLMILGAEDEVGLKEYLAEEPFARDGVWLSWQAHPFRIAPLPYAPLPGTGRVPDLPTHQVMIAEHGAARRPAAQQAQLARLRGAAAEGLLSCAGTLLDAGGAVVGSVALTRHAGEPEARRWWAEDPCAAQGLWRELRFHPTRFVPLPYRPLPGAPAGPA